jgi:hypothetical protein
MKRGKEPRIVPDHAAGWILVRNKDELEEWANRECVQPEQRLKPKLFPCLVTTNWASDDNQMDVLDLVDVADMLVILGGKRHVTKLIDAAIAYADVAERHLAHEEWKTRTLQEAANLARTGATHEAEQKQGEVDQQATVVFDYEDVHKNLIRAVKPFRVKKSRRCN